MADRWARDPRYAHGYFVPMFALALLWMRRPRLEGAASRPTALGLGPVAMGAALQLAGGYYRIEWFDGLALLPYLGGLTLILGGRRYLDWAWPSIAFLAFMVPLPWRMETALGPPLQFLATTASTYLLQTLGFMAFAEGLRDPAQRGPDRRRRGVQRPEHADDLHRAVDGRGAGGAAAAAGPARPGRQLGPGGARWPMSPASA